MGHLKNRINLSCALLFDLNSNYYFPLLPISLIFCLKRVLDTLKDDHNLRRRKKDKRETA